MAQYQLVHFNLNGKDVERMVDVRASLTDMLRNDYHMTSVKKGSASMPASSWRTATRRVRPAAAAFCRQYPRGVAKMSAPPARSKAMSPTMI